MYVTVINSMRLAWAMAWATDIVVVQTNLVVSTF